LFHRSAFALFELTVIAVPLWAAHPVRAADPAPSSLGQASTEGEALARQFFAEGLAHADAARWTEASDSFTRAYALRPTPQIAYNLSTALVRQGRLVRASQLLGEITNDAGARPGVRDAARARLAEVLPRMGRLTVAASARDREHLWLDGRPVDPALSARAMTVDPGTHVLEVRPSAHGVLSRRVSIEEGAQQTVIFESPLPAAAIGPSGPGHTIDLSTTPPARSRASILREGWFWAVLGTAVVATTAVLLVSRGSDSELRGNVGTLDLRGQ
jgi:hypothetical protein